MFEREYRAEMDRVALSQGQLDRIAEAMAAEPRTTMRRMKGRRMVMLAAAVILLAACTGAAVMTLRQSHTYYFDTEEEAARAADEAAQKAGASTAGFGFDAEKIEDYPPQEPLDMERMMSFCNEILEHKMGGNEDGWTEMFVGVGDITRQTRYKADTLAALAFLWPTELPDLDWLEERFTPVPGCQYYCQMESGAGAIHNGIYVGGEYQTAQGSPFCVAWNFHPGWEASDQYMVTDVLDKVEQYETVDGVTVDIEWRTSVNGQSRFYTSFSYGTVEFAMDGAEMEEEEVHRVLDHMNLSALSEYKAN